MVNWVFIIVGVLVVMAVGFVAVGSALGRLEATVQPVVFEVDDVVEWIAERLPAEAAGQLSHLDVVKIVGWYLDYFDSMGLATEHGQELGEAAIDEDADRIVARLDDALNVLVARGLAEPEPLDPLSVAVVADLLSVYMSEMGAIGGTASPEGTG
ncbi:MAG TPA: hypothetical protein DF783_06185 [Acidimicrobiaceae bacterium]|nr:hypothetical protein [Acidimicrobiaceae bacterium]HCV36497.1 hypothetical protein [Acidimicrobiaceae bacterium]